MLAGGLNAENVAEGIRIFSPDVADISSGVEVLCDGKRMKNKIKIKVKLKRQEGKVTDAPSTPTPTVE